MCGVRQPTSRLRKRVLGSYRVFTNSRQASTAPCLGRKAVSPSFLRNRPAGVGRAAPRMESGSDGPAWFDDVVRAAS